MVDVLGRERDLEVLRDHLGALVARHEAPDAAQEGWIDESLSEDLDAARGAARVALDSERYDALVLALAAAGWPPWSSRAERHARGELRRGLRAEWERLQAAATAAEHAPAGRRDEALHEVRKVAKRLRYAAEAAEPCLGDRARDLADAMSALQDSLGLHHDEAVARAAVARLGQEWPRAAGVSRIIGELEDQQAVESAIYREGWWQVRHSTSARWLV